MTDKAPLLEIAALDVAYGRTIAVSGFSLILQRGECYGLVGESGSGKTSVGLSVMRWLSGGGRITGGRIRLEGHDMLRLDRAGLRRMRGGVVGMVYQEPGAALNPCMTIGRQLLEVVEQHRPDLRDRQARIDAIAEMLAAIRLSAAPTLMRRYPHELSGGQQQRVMVAMALLPRPKLLLLDEPTTALDVTVEADIIERLNALRQAFGTTVLFISHNLGLVRTICDRVGVMYGGELIEEGPAGALFAAPRHPYTRALLDCAPTLLHRSEPRSIPGEVAVRHGPPRACVFAPRCAHCRPATCEDAPVALEADGSRQIRCVRWREIKIDLAQPLSPVPSDFVTPAGKPVLVARHVDKSYGSARWWWRRSRTPRPLANRDISLEIARGETLALVGESGSGKSTFARLGVGLEVVSAGTLAIADVEVGRTLVQDRERALVHQVQMVFQNYDRTLNPELTIGQALGRAIVRLAGLRGRDAVAREIARLLALVQLPPHFAQRLPHELSGGQKQRVAVARAFAGQPALVLADEPISALDISVKSAVLNLLMQAKRLRHAGLLFISHDLAVVRSIADRVAIMYGGEIVESGTADAVFAPPYHPYSEALLAAVPVIDPRLQVRDIPKVQPPAAVRGEFGTGCVFAARCHRRLAGDICHTVRPPERRFVAGHLIHCHLPEPVLIATPPIFTRS